MEKSLLRICIGSFLIITAMQTATSAEMKWCQMHKTTGGVLVCYNSENICRNATSSSMSEFYTCVFMQDPDS